MNSQEQAYITGFIKAAQEVGLTEGQAVDLLKTAEKEKDEHSSSWLGRYLASKHLTNSIMANKREIMDEIDPDYDMQNKHIFLPSKKYTEQRNVAYDLIPKTLKRETAGSMGKNLLVGGALGGGVGALLGSPAGVGTPVGALIGALTGSGAAGLERLFNKYEQRKITDEDIRRMKEKQKNYGYMRDLLPFKDVYDAAVA